MAVGARPVSHDFNGDRANMADGVDMAGEAAQGISLGACGEAQTVTFIQITLDQRLQGGVRVHAALPGHGRATAVSLRLSSLA